VMRSTVLGLLPSPDSGCLSKITAYQAIEPGSACKAAVFNHNARPSDVDKYSSDFVVGNLPREYY
jgi:hypothetical protein